MHKVEIARLVALEMRKINPAVDARRTSLALARVMSKEELQKALAGFQKQN